MVHSRTVHLPLGALLSPCSVHRVWRRWDSDYPTSTADVCAPDCLPPSAPPLSLRRVHEVERRVLAMLDYSTVVTQA